MHTLYGAECALRLLSAPANANANDDNLISVVEDFSPPALPMPTDFTVKSDGYDMFLGQAVAIC